MPYRRTQTWRDWFFLVFAPNGRMPFHPLPKNEAELREDAERAKGEMLPKGITRLNLDNNQPSR
jgi:hypothetical protein